MSAPEKTTVMGVQATERVRKSSLATENKAGRKTSFVTFVDENNTTIGYSDEQTESSDVVDNMVGWKGSIERSSIDEETLQQRKFSRFNDSLKINKRRLSRDEKETQTGK